MKSFVDDLSIRMAIKDSSFEFFIEEKIVSEIFAEIFRKVFSLRISRDFKRPILKAKYTRGRIITSARRETFMLQAAYAKVI